MRLVHFHPAQPNFGDDLNAELWPRLLPGLFDDDADECFLGIGTIIGMATPARSMLHVFSSGAGYDALDRWNVPRHLWCVRGPLTAHLLGADPNVALTDGAILTPDAFGPPPVHEDNAVAVIPHWQSLRFPGWPEACAMAGLRLVTPIDTPANVYAAIANARLVLTESLHGAIFADTLGVPWVPFVGTRNVSAFKWVDWCLSVGVAFAPVAIAPPSAAAALTFGRPAGAAWGSRLAFDADAAMAEYHGRNAHQAAYARPPGAAARLRGWLRGQASRNALAGRALGYGPARTASQLSAATALAPSLSAAATRSRLRAEMLYRLDAFARAARPRLVAAE